MFCPGKRHIREGRTVRPSSGGTLTSLRNPTGAPPPAKGISRSSSQAAVTRFQVPPKPVRGRVRVLWYACPANDVGCRIWQVVQMNRPCEVQAEGLFDSGGRGAVGLLGVLVYFERREDAARVRENNYSHLVDGSRRDVAHCPGHSATAKRAPRFHTIFTFLVKRGMYCFSLIPQGWQFLTVLGQQPAEHHW